MALKLTFLGAAFLAFGINGALNADVSEKSPLETHVRHLAGDITLANEKESGISIDDLLKKSSCSHWEDPNCH